LAHSRDLVCLAISDEFVIQDDNLLFLDDVTINLIKKTGFIQRGIQYIAGLLQINDILYITYGIHDYSAKQFKIDCKIVEQTLVKI
jgi:hypothetical protein